MRKFLSIFIGFFTVLSPVIRAETLEEVQARLMAAHARLKSYTADFKRVEDVPLTGTDFMASDTEGTVEWMRKGDEILYRMEITGTSTQKLGPEEHKTQQSSTLICDGKLFHTVSEQLGQKVYVKQDRDDSIVGNIQSVLDTVRADFNFQLGADDKVDGADCYAIEVTPKLPPSDADPIHKTFIFFRKDNGLCVKVVSRNKSGKDVFVHTLRNLKTDVPIDVARFVFKGPPPDAQVRDLTAVEQDTTSVPAKP